MRGLSLIFDHYPTGRVVPVIKGGIGNQLFIYTAALVLERHLGCQIFLDCWSGFGSHDRYKRDYQLAEYLQIKHDNIRSGYDSRVNRALYRLASRSLSDKLRLVGDEDISTLIDDFANRSNPAGAGCTFLLDGYFQDWQLPEMVDYELLALFGVAELAEARGHFLKRFPKPQSAAAIHLRRFENTPKEDEFLRDYCDRLKGKLSERGVTNFVIFSEDRELAESAVALFGERATYASPMMKSDREEFFLMSQFPTIAITQSTFGWWAAWLGMKSGRTESVYASKAAKKEGRSTWIPDKMIAQNWISL